MHYSFQKRRLEDFSYNSGFGLYLDACGIVPFGQLLGWFSLSIFTEIDWKFIAKISEAKWAETFLHAGLAFHLIKADDWVAGLRDAKP